MPVKALREPVTTGSYETPLVSTGISFTVHVLFNIPGMGRGVSV